MTAGNRGGVQSAKSDEFRRGFATNNMKMPYP